MTCPFCGAKQIFSGKFECGTINDMRSPACYESEIEKLREKKAEGLTWEATLKGKTLLAQTPLGYMTIFVFVDECRLVNRIVGNETRSKHADIDAAKAHAEELHQQAWREQRERWDAV